VGAGGKTSLLFALAREAAEQWGSARVVVTTTTKILEPSAGDFPTPASEVRLVDSPAEAVEAAVCVGRTGRLPVLATGTVPAPGETRPKLAGLPAEWVDEIHRAQPDWLILVEADGSAKKPLKAPAAHEPVIPASSAVVVGVAGLDALGLPIDAEHVHRPEVVARVAGRGIGQMVDEATMAAVLMDPNGCGKGRPPGSRLVPVVNKVDPTAPPGATTSLEAACRVAAELRRRGAPEVLLTSCLHWPVVVEALGRGGPVGAVVPLGSVGAVILAAGTSSRMGRTKQLLSWRGEALVAAVARQVLAAPVDPVVVVVGHEAEAVHRALEPLAVEAGGRLWFVASPQYREGGQSASLKAGIGALPEQTGAVIIALCDQPLIRARDLEALVERSSGPGSIAVPVHNGQRGHPVLFGRDFFAELLAVSGDEGGRAVLRRHPEAVIEVPAGPEALQDLDTWEDYQRLLATTTERGGGS
jgi:molybdenum cofactor cytidylyltransferase